MAPFEPGRFDRRVIEIARKVPGLDAGLRVKLEALLPMAAALDAATRKLPRASRAAIDEIRRELRRLRNPAAKLARLRQLHESPRTRSVAGLPEGLEVAIALLRDGRTTVYSKTYPFHREIADRSGWTTFEHREDKTEEPPGPNEVTDEDTDGAIMGGVAGGATGALLGVGAAGGGAIVAGGVGAIGGALGGAIYLSGAKAIDLIGKAWDNLWGGIAGSL
jgi:hypothetical protein